MSDLIRREDIYKFFGFSELCESCTLKGGKANCSYTDITLNDLCNDIDLIPAVDAVEVVRCKDCKHGHYCLDQDDSHGYRCDKRHDNNHRPDWFCADGKRKDGAE